MAPCASALDNPAEVMMTLLAEYSLMLRFRDLVTEPGANIEEHRKIIRNRGYAWWGWWARQREHAPRLAFAALFSADANATDVVLFDSGMMRFYRTQATQVVVAPSRLGVNSPDFEATPDYYVRGRYPAWFRLAGDIAPASLETVQVVARPSLDADVELLPGIVGLPTSLEALRDDRATLWVIRTPRQE